MGLYGFKEQFAPMIAVGRKRHTIRAPRRYEDKPGSTMHFYVGLRTKKCRRLGMATCTAVQDIRIWKRAPWLPVAVEIDGVRLGPARAEKLAFHDGFANLAEMAAFWEGNLPFTGKIYHWGEKHA